MSRIVPQRGPRFIAVGLFLLVATQFWPALPGAVSAAMLVALGATLTLLPRFSTSVSGHWLAIVHLVTYGGLFGLFAGAVVDRSWSDGGSVGPLLLADLAIGTGIFLAVVGQTLAALTGGKLDRC